MTPKIGDILLAEDVKVGYRVRVRQASAAKEYSVVVEGVITHIEEDSKKPLTYSFNFNGYWVDYVTSDTMPKTDLYDRPSVITFLGIDFNKRPKPSPGTIFTASYVNEYFDNTIKAVALNDGNFLVVEDSAGADVPFILSWEDITESAASIE